ncbi:MAG: tetratricopeptide repeat protein [Anaerolineales bacterium]
MSEDTLQDIIDLEAQGYRATAMRRLNEYLEANPTSAAGYFTLARLVMRPAERFAAIEQALHHRPDYPEAQRLRAALLDEHPELAQKRGLSPGARVGLLMFGAVLLIGGLGLGAVFLLPEDEPEVVVVAPETTTPPATVPPPPPANTQPASATPSALAASATPSAVPATAEPTAGGMIISATPRPSATATPGAAIPAAGATPALLAIPEDALQPFAATLEGLPVQVIFSTERPTEADAAAATLGDPNEIPAGLVVYETEAGLTVFLRDVRPRAAQVADLLPLARPAQSWHISLGEDAAATLRGAAAYITLDQPATIEALGPLFANPRADLSPPDILLGFMLAYAHNASGEHDSALALYETLSAFDSDLTPAIAANRAYSIAQTGDVASAARLYLDLAADDPAPGFIQSNIARIYTDAGQLDAARLAADEAIETAPDDPRPYLERGRILAAQDDPLAALDAFGEALSQDNAYAPAWYEMARVRLALGTLQEAQTDIDQARSLQPDVAAYQRLAGQIARARADWATAAEALRQAASLGAGDALADWAWAEYQLGNLDAAIQAANRALSENRDDARAWLARGRAYMAQNELGSALNDFGQGLDRAPAEVDLLVARCEVHNRLGNPADAAQDCDAALSIDPANAAALVQRGILRHNADDRPGAAQDFAEAVTLNPEAHQAHYYLGLYALQERRYQDAITALSQAVDRAPQLGPAYAARGVAYRISGAWELAIADLEQALILLPEDEYNHYELGLAYRALADQAYEANNETRAIDLYENAADNFRTFLNASQPSDPFVAEATEGLRYVNSALNVIRGGS